MRRLVGLLVLIVACSSSPSASQPSAAQAGATNATFSVVPVEATSAPTPVPPEVGPELQTDRLPPLPANGVVLEVEGLVILIGFDGEVLGHLPGFAIDYRITAPGPVSLYDDEGVGWVLDPPDLYRSDYVPLAHGGLLRMPPISGSVDRGAEVVQGELVPATSPTDNAFVGAARETVTFGWPALNRSASPLLVDLSIGVSSDAPVNCGVGAGSGDSIYLVCATFGSGESLASIERLTPDGNRTLLAGSVGNGFWRWIIPSPDGSVVLAQWSGECEVPVGYWIEGGTSVTITGASLADSPNSHVIGWSPDGEAVVILESSECGTRAEGPGVYLARRPGDLRLLYPTDVQILTGRLWGQLMMSPS